ncbi:MAG: acetylornithine deacetylase [Sandaracinus sp.]|nr:acetylornithine deacetylase [Sandaracinus sp.]
MSLPETVEMIRSLVAEPSVSSPDPRHDQSNRAVVDRLAEWAEHLGFRAEVVPLATDPSKANLIATLGDGEGGLVLSGHTDTVPTEAAGWATDPWELTERDEGTLYGLGSADMKGFFGAALTAAARFAAGDLKAPLTIVGTADEESSMDGARQLLAEGRPRAAMVVVGEPTGLVPVRMHKGILMHRVEVEGRSGHSSNPALGANAIDGMMQVIGALQAFRAELGERREDAFEVPGATLNLGRIEGGDSPNRICGQCALTYDVRVLPGMAPAQLRADLEARVRAALDPRLRVTLEELVESVPPFAIDEEAEAVALLRELTGRDPRAVMFCTEAPFFQELGAQTVICGPGSIDVAHQPDEHVTRGQLQEAVDIYAQTIHAVCVEGRGPR